jgi:hypothetical protein
MDAILTHIASKVLAANAKTARADLPTGTHTVNETVLVNISGTLNVGEDYPQDIVAKADPWLLLAAALSHLNSTTVESIVRESLTADPKLVKSLKANAKAAIARLVEPTKTICNGKVTLRKGATVTVIGAQAEAV